MPHHGSAHADENENNHSEPQRAPTSYAEHARSTQASHLFNAGSKPKDDYDRFMDDSLKAQEKAIERSLHSSNESRMHELEEAVRHADGEVHAHAALTHHSSWWQRTKQEASLGIHHPFESILGGGKEAVNLGLDALDFVTGSSGMQPQFTITPEQRAGADVVNIASFFGGGAAFKELCWFRRHR